MRSLARTAPPLLAPIHGAVFRSGHGVGTARAQKAISWLGMLRKASCGLLSKLLAKEHETGLGPARTGDVGNWVILGVQMSQC